MLLRSAQASSVGQSGGRSTGGPAPPAGRGARPGKGGLRARRGELPRKHARSREGDKARSLAPLGPARAGMENPEGGGGCALAGYYAPHPSFRYTTPCAGPAPQDAGCAMVIRVPGHSRPVTTRTRRGRGLHLEGRVPGFRRPKWARSGGAS